MWSPGSTIVRREVWRGQPWTAMVNYVVEDSPELLVLYLPEGGPFVFADLDFPGGRHPWRNRRGWEGHGPLALHRPADPYAVLVFWEGPGRDFAGWYVNFQAPFVRHVRGIDTLDHEIDIWIPAGGRWEWKDLDHLDDRVADGRFTAAEAEAIRAEGDRIARDLDAGRRWWSEEWASWEPDPAWAPQPVPDDWRA